MDQTPQKPQTYTISHRHPLATNITKDNRLVCLQDVTKESLNKFFSNPIHIDRYTTDQYFNLAKIEKDACKHNLHYWVGAHFNKNENDDYVRRIEHFKARNLLSYDIDYGSPKTLKELIKTLKNHQINYFIHSSLSHNPSLGSYRYRLIIPCSFEITSRLVYEKIFYHFCKLLNLDHKIFDKQATNNLVSAVYSPAKLKDQIYEYEYHTTGEDFYVDVATLVDESELRNNPTYSQNSLLPSQMSGMRGTFNSVYTAIEVLHVHNNDLYAPVDESDPLNPQKRWTYLQGSSTGGIRFYENGEWLHSDHETDPLHGQQNGKSKQWDAYHLYIQLAHAGNEKAALEDIAKNKKVLNKIASEFDEIEAYVVENQKNREFSFTPQEEIEEMILEKNPSTVLKFILDRCYLMLINGSVEFLLPVEHSTIKSIVDPETNKFYYTKRYEPEFIRLKRGSGGFDSFFGYSGSFTDPYSPKKTLTPSEYVLKYFSNLKRYVGKTFLPFNKYSEKGQKIRNSQINSLRLNVFSGFAVDPDFNYVSVEETQKMLHKFQHYVTEILCSGDKDAATWVFDWVADIFQNPEDKPGTALVLYSPEFGIGKSSLFNILNILLGNHAQILNTQTLSSQFNFSLSYCLVGAFEDIEWQAKKNAGQIRSLITEDKLRIESKGEDAYQVYNTTRFIITSNHKHMAEIDGEMGERRYTMLRVKDYFKAETQDETPKEVKVQRKSEYFNELYYYINKYAGALLAWLLDRKITRDIKYMHKTTLYEEIKDSGYTYLDSLFNDLRFKTFREIAKELSGEKVFDEQAEAADQDAEYVYLKKKTVFRYYKDHYGAQYETSHSFNKKLQDSKLIQRNNIEYTGCRRGYRCHHKFNGKVADAFRIPKNFFEVPLNEE